jgi:catechol 2,3-dioxygenase-like lactoylglutathione lyase family enzyme
LSGMIDHVSLGVADLVLSRAFYDAALAPLGFRRLFDVADASGYGPALPAPLKEQALAFWIGQERGDIGRAGHVCFAAPDRAAVDRFYRAAVDAGGRDNGPPGLRPIYHPNYYAAFVIDPDGHRIEAVRHQPD